MADIKVTEISVPVELVKRSCGLSMDIGASAAKAVYRSKENYEEALKTNDKFGHLSLLCTSCTNFPAAMQHIAQSSMVDRDIGSGVIYSTGLGCTLHGKTIGEALNLKLESVPEFDSFVKAFVYLVQTVPRSRLFYDLDEERQIPGHILIDLVKSLLASGQSLVTGADLNRIQNPQVIIERANRETVQPVAEVEKDILPCVLFICGSSNVHLQVNADESYIFLDGSTRGGLNFFGLGSLLTGAQTFDELLELAMAGNAHNIDVYTDEIANQANATSEQEDSMYTKAISDAKLAGNVIYGFAKCVGKKIGDFSREDLARSLLDQFLADYAQTVTLVCTASGIKRCCFSGNFVNTQFVRDLLTQEMDRRNLCAKIRGKETIKFDFLKPGGHLGALGALVSHYKKFNNAK